MIRQIVDAIHSGALAKSKTRHNTVFGFDVITECPSIPGEILDSRGRWPDKSAFHETAKKLAGLFREYFKAYEDRASTEVKSAGATV